MFTGDLHCHSLHSDGSMDVESIITLAKRLRIRALSITDHDTLAGTTRAMKLGYRYGVHMIPGVEISAYDERREHKAHILCYGYRRPDVLQPLLDRINEARYTASVEMIRQVLGEFPITPAHIMRWASRSDSIYKQHIMHALMDMGYSTSIFGSLFDDLLHAHTGRFYVSPTYPSVEEVIETVHAAGGLAVLAHPALYNGIESLHGLASEGLLDGVEVWHPSASAELRRHLAELADRYGLLATGGSDFHGLYGRDATPLGSCVTPEDRLVSLVSLSNIRRHLQQKSAVQYAYN